MTILSFIARPIALASILALGCGPDGLDYAHNGTLAFEQTIDASTNELPLLDIPVFESKEFASSETFAVDPIASAPTGDQSPLCFPCYLAEFESKERDELAESASLNDSSSSLLCSETVELTSSLPIWSYDENESESESTQEAASALQKQINGNNFNTKRSLEDYYKIFPPEFKQALKNLSAQRGVWLDAGSGSCKAIIEFLSDTKSEPEPHYSSSAEPLISDLDAPQKSSIRARKRHYRVGSERILQSTL